MLQGPPKSCFAKTIPRETDNSDPRSLPTGITSKIVQNTAGGLRSMLSNPKPYITLCLPGAVPIANAIYSTPEHNSTIPPEIRKPYALPTYLISPAEATLHTAGMKIVRRPTKHNSPTTWARVQPSTQPAASPLHSFYPRNNPPHSPWYPFAWTPWRK